MRSLYPEIEPFATHRLPAGALHTLYAEESGRPDGIPVVFLHGGPGSGCQPYHRRFFDPACYRIVLFDQRGAGRSTPTGELRENTTQDLIADLDSLRRHLRIERWLVFGGSWGVTLALAYAQAHTENVTGLILRGTFLGTRREVDWLFRDGASRIFPEAWPDFADLLEDADDADPIAVYHEHLMSSQSTRREDAARRWTRWSDTVATHTLGNAGSTGSGNLERMQVKARMECHYAANAYFLEPGRLLADCIRLRELPAVIVHGRRDLICTPESAWRLHQALPQSQLVVLKDAGHLANETPMIDALVNATRTMAERLSNS